ncbi:hypothetical protein RBA41_13040 [Massilia sp. CCM 9210]|uniref:hypothetical protein n=1 Tax=Massilia scottii TaxID=3057166 RepID=UPI002796B5C9|nr:hypothetical protein [Massilia sp. CCM 9210]MDQ1814234.1 hypothetical protein [Massilia sp. CCM 9210]
MRMLTALALSLAVLAPVAHGAPLAASHPILGIWTLKLPGGGCSETYRFRGDGTTLVISAAEVSESKFEIPAKPSAAGFYKLVDKNVKVNGKPDCSGKVMKTGATGINFIRFHPSGTLFVMCAAESLDACIGPFRRVAGKET